MSTYTTSSIVVCEELLDRDAEIKCANNSWSANGRHNRH
jgi:hypothetical protein